MWIPTDTPNVKNKTQNNAAAGKDANCQAPVAINAAIIATKIILPWVSKTPSNTVVICAYKTAANPNMSAKIN